MTDEQNNYRCEEELAALRAFIAQWCVEFNLDPRSTPEFLREFIEHLFARKREEIAELHRRIDDLRKRLLI